MDGLFDIDKITGNPARGAGIVERSRNTHITGTNVANHW